MEKNMMNRFFSFKCMWSFWNKENALQIVCFFIWLEIFIL